MTAKEEQRVDRLYREFIEHQEQFEAYRMDQQKLYQELLTAIKDNTTAVSALASRTEGILEIWEASQGAYLFAKWVGKLVLWVSSTMGAIVGVYWLIKTGHIK